MLLARALAMNKQEQDVKCDSQGDAQKQSGVATTLGHDKQACTASTLGQVVHEVTLPPNIPPPPPALPPSLSLSLNDLVSTSYPPPPPFLPPSEGLLPPASRMPLPPHTVPLMLKPPVPQFSPPIFAPLLPASLLPASEEAAPCWDAWGVDANVRNPPRIQIEKHELNESVTKYTMRDEQQTSFDSIPLHRAIPIKQEMASASPTTCSGSENESLLGFSSVEGSLSTSGSEGDLTIGCEHEKLGTFVKPLVGCDCDITLSPPPGLELAADLPSLGSRLHSVVEQRKKDKRISPRQANAKLNVDRLSEQKLTRALGLNDLV